ncbi:MAG TPA: PDZ domain-containing protein [Polyangia bacterium]|nr:PDZ domain-containing protein [Polyangia bacterium]
MAPPRPSRTRSVAPIVYRVSFPDPGSHELHVQMEVPALPDRATAQIVFPAWAPGSYLVRDFVRHVYGLSIVDDRGRALPAQRLDKQRWEVPSGGRPFRVSYRVFAFEASVRTSFVDDSHAYWNGSSAFFYVDGEVARPCQVVVAPPAGRGWRVDTALPSLPGRRLTFGAADFDELVDSPFEVGTHSLTRFRAGRATFELALYGRTNADRRRLVDILRRVVTTTARIFGGYPFRRYLFIVHALPVQTGGLEHKASVTMDIAGLSFDDEGGYHRFADLAAHEFFHVWNVKRIRDRVLGPFDYTRENYTRLLWLHEGFTDYLANVIIQRAGVLPETHFWRWIAEEFPKYANRPGRNVTPLSELSFEAWIKLYKPAENHINDTVSYYEKGLWAGLVLDLMLRARTAGARGLPDVFRRLWDKFGARDQPIDEAAVRAATAAVAEAPMDGFFDRYIHGLDELPVLALLRKAGLVARPRAEWEPEEPRGKKDGKKDDNDNRDRLKDQRLRAWSGITLFPERTVIRNVVPRSPAAAAGLTFNDEVVAVDGDRVNATTFAKRIADHRPGDPCRISFFRRDILQDATLILRENPERKLVVKPDPDAGAAALAIRRGWLSL